MTSLGVLRLNYIEQNRMKCIYLRYNYENEKREARRLLGERFDLLTRGADNVITLQRRQKATEPLFA